MIICFVCSERTKQALDTLVEHGQYKDYTEAITSAIENLTVLQREITKKGAIVIGRVSASNLDMPCIDSIVKLDAEQCLQINGIKEGKRPWRKKEAGTIPTIFLLNGIAGTPPRLVEPLSDPWMASDIVPLDRWVFGQYNRLLPAKASCRAMAYLLSCEPNGVPLSEAVSKISAEAVALGDFLVERDKQNAIRRDEALSTAFPSTADNPEKGRLRYANQFVASVSKEGKLSGLLTDLKLVTYSRDEASCLWLTEIGWRFALLRNPILEEEEEKPTSKFSTEETAFLLDHIAHSVPTEAFAYRTILTAILEGADTPAKVDTVLQKYIPRSRSRNLTESFLASQRSGAISRMADLGLVTRIRDGVRVFYTVTEAGKQFMHSELTP